MHSSSAQIVTCFAPQCVGAVLEKQCNTMLYDGHRFDYYE